jgi:hypothetical protein
MRKQSSWPNKVLHRMPKQGRTGRFGYGIFTATKSCLPMTVSDFGDAPLGIVPGRQEAA